MKDRHVKLTRRVILDMSARLGVAFGLGPVVATAAAQEGATRGEGLPAREQRTFAAYLDTLIPDEERSPGAVAAGVDSQFDAAVRDNVDVREFVAQGCRWLDTEAAKAGARFADLDEAGRTRIVERAAAAPSASEERQFFEVTLYAAVTIYYAKPAAWSALGYDGPPQPEGFLDYAEPPAGRP